MKITKTAIPDVLILEPEIFADERGFFMESYNKRDFREATGLDPEFVQDNHSRSTKNVLRGLHYQIRQAQGKLMRVVVGEIYDVAIDLRKASPTFGHWVGFTLSAMDRRLAWIPMGFAHGFLVLSEYAEFFYKTTDYYSPQHERTILWNDRDIGIHWPNVEAPLLSDKDLGGEGLVGAEVFE